MFEQMSLWLVIPEILLVLGGCACLIASTFQKHVDKNGLFGLAMVVLAVVLFELIVRFGAPFSMAFGHAFQFDDEATMLKMCIVVITMLILGYGRMTLEHLKMPMGELYCMVLLATSGMFLLCSAMNLLTLFLGIELMSLPLYGLVAIHRQNKTATEAALKYFVMGALSSGLLLFGFSLLYGATGTFSLVEIHQFLMLPAHMTLMVGLACVFIVAGMAFKLGLAPFHMWVPDVYQAAPTPVACLVATTPKIAMTGMLLHLFVQAMHTCVMHWGMMMSFVALLSVVLGNVIALIQKDFKRMLAYSSIGHMGILVLAMVNNNHLGVQAMLFYIITYALTTAVAFGGCMFLQNHYQESCKIDDFKGLNRVYPGMAFCMMMAMFSMAGVPPLVGFMAKFSVLDALLKSGYTTWSVVMVLASVVGAYYYIRVIKVMYFDQPEEGALMCLGGQWLRCGYVVNGFALLLMGVMPSLLYGLITMVI